MEATAVVREGWGLYKRHWRTFVPLAAIVYVILGVVGVLLVALLSWLGAIFAALLGILGTFWLQGALVEAVSDVRDGRQDLSLAETFRRVQPRLPAIIPAGLIAAIAIFAGLLLLIVPGLYLLTIWLLIIPVIVLEGRSAGESFGRSRELVKGHGWTVFGVSAITVAVMLVASIILGIVTAPLDDKVGNFVRDVVSNTLVAPFAAVTWTLTYFALAQPGSAAATATPAAPPPPA